jgi:hypothetical protein
MSAKSRPVRNPYQQDFEARLKTLQEIFLTAQYDELLHSDKASTRLEASGEILDSRNCNSLQHQAIPERGICVCPQDSSAIIVSIDFEFDNHHEAKGKPPIREIGISTFDSRDIHQTPKEPHSIISTQNLVWKPKPSRATKASHHPPAPKFLFGKPKIINHEEIPEVIE